MDNDEEIEVSEERKNKEWQTVKQVFKNLIATVFTCIFISNISEEEPGFIFPILGVIIILLLLEYALEFRKPPENRNYAYLFLIVSIFIGIALGYLIMPTNQGILIGAGVSFLVANFVLLGFTRQINDQLKKLFVREE